MLYKIDFSRNFGGFYTGNVLETDRRNIDVKNLNPLAPPGTSAKIMKNKVIV